MRRRDFITLFGGATVFAVRDDVSAESRLVRLGVLGPVAPTPTMLDSLRTGLHEFGYIEGKNLLIEVRWLHGSVAENVSVASELVRANVDAIIAWATPAVIAARGASTTIPIVMVGVGDPVGSGLVASLARPGGNITGISNMSAQLNSKLVQLLVGLIPGADFVGVVVNSDNPGSGALVRGSTDAIHSLGLRSQVIEARTPGEFESAFQHMHADGTKAVVMIADPSLVEYRSAIADMARKVGLPTGFQRRENVDAGGLLSYGPNTNDQFSRAAFYVDRILKGAKPAELPVEQPTAFEFVINLKTAKELGIEVPANVQQLATEVIE